MIVAKTINADEEKDLLQGWFDTVAFDDPSEGIPPLAPEEDDEGRSLSVSSVDTEELLAELRKRDPDNPF